jgi:nucleoside-diphosphate-sugar epimerase
VRRLVHLSTISVYGLPGDGDLDERRARQPCGDDYSDTKLAAEQLVFSYHEKYGLPVAVLQPTIVYGPYSWPWTLMPLAFLKHERVVLVEGGTGLCNAVYVDDVVDAILLAAVRDEAVGQAFLISGDTPVTWRQFYGAYEHMLGEPATVPMSVAEIEATRRQRRRERGTIRQIVRVLRNNPQLRTRLLELPAVGAPYRWIRNLAPSSARNAIGQRLFPETQPGSPKRREKPMQLPDAYHTRFFRARTRVRIDKARELLGYQPRFSFEDGMALTSQWAAWANLL